MKVVILAGGLGTRLSEETGLKPKPMIEIGNKPILWHIMKIYSSYGFKEFVILLGYKSYAIKEYFLNYYIYQSDITIDLHENGVKIHKNNCENWKVTLLDTGLHTMTGGRIKRAKKYLKDTFMLTYGDGLADIDLAKVLDFHKQHGKALTMTSVQPEGRFGVASISQDNSINSFTEKPKGDHLWTNGGFFICEPKVLEYIQGDYVSFENEPLEKMAKDGQAYSYKHQGFWKCMDTQRDMVQLNDIWETGEAKWKIWKD